MLFWVLPPLPPCAVSTGDTPGTLACPLGSISQVDFGKLIKTYCYMIIYCAILGGVMPKKGRWCLVGDSCSEGFHTFLSLLNFTASVGLPTGTCGAFVRNSTCGLAVAAKLVNVPTNETENHSELYWLKLRSARLGLFVVLSGLALKCQKPTL
jgi:hypothetical protein